MRRRDFIMLLGGAAAAPIAWAAAVRTQEAGRTYRIGGLSISPRDAPYVVAIFDELQRLGFIEGQNLTIHWREYGLRIGPISEFAAELAKTRVNVILALGEPGIRAAQRATASIPIVGSADDMVGSGLVRSLARPGGNTTGISILATELDGKRQEILTEAVPRLRRMAVLANSNITAPLRLKALEDAARARGVELSIHQIARQEEIPAAIDAAKASGAAALNVLASPILGSNRPIILQRVAALRLPAMYQWPEAARQGGLVAYGPSSRRNLSRVNDPAARQALARREACRSAGRATDQIRAGDQPQDREGARARNPGIILGSRRRGDRMRRRDFIAFVGGAAASWPLAARAQQRDGTRLIGVLMGYAESDPGAQSMVEADRIKMLAKELVELRPDAIVGQSTPVIGALARETQATPIVFMLVTDPIGSGFTASLAHPGGNVTGFMVDDSALGGKWLGLLKEVAPRTSRVALLFNPVGPPIQSFMPSIQAAASAFNVQVSVATVNAENELEGVISAQARDPIGGIIVLPNVFNNTNLKLIISQAARYRVPAVYFTAYCAQAGGLISYGPDYDEEARQAAEYVDRILKGAKPGDLPVQAPTKFELVVNLKAAKALGIDIPNSMQLLADEVIE